MFNQPCNQPPRLSLLHAPPRLLGLLLALITALALTLPAHAQGGDSITIPDSVGFVGSATSLALDGNGYPVVSYADETNFDLKVMHCNDANCDSNVNGAESITSPDTVGEVGGYTSLALDSNGYPVVSYADFTNLDLKVMRCNDANCDPNVNGAESITSPDTAGDVGWYISLVLDGNGYPVVSYWDITNDNLKVLHCNDANCDPNGNGAESITSPDADGNVGEYTSLVLDGNGYPVISYYDRTNRNLKVLHCNDANCDPNVNGAESITSPDATADAGQDTSLILDGNGYPVVSYYDNNIINRNPKVLHCNDPNCDPNVNGAESITSPDSDEGVGKYSSLVLDSNGYPVISYYDGDNADLKVLHCNDPNCDPNVNGTESITSPDTRGGPGEFTSLALDSDGYPVISYWAASNEDLRVIHCNDPACANAAPVASDESYSTEADTPLTIAAPGVLGNDSDADGDALTAVLDSGPNNGALTLNPDGSFTYTPNSGFVGDDSFTYKANDGAGDGNIATVTITVEQGNRAPIAVEIPVITTQDTAIAFRLRGFDPDGDALTYSVESQPSNGTLSGIAPALVYTPNPGFSGFDSFTFKVNDGLADSDVIEIFIVIEATTAPFATCGGYDVFETAPGVYAAPSFAGSLIVGSDGYDWLIGTDGPDLMLGLQGGDDIWGNNGDDVICGGAGVDIILGGKGNDTIYGDDQPDWIVGGLDNDTIYGGEGADDLFGNAGNDTLHGEGGKDVLLGGVDDDALYGGEDDDSLYGNLGNDQLFGGPAADFCLGGFGSDTIAECEGASAADATADATDIDEETVRRSNDGANGENAIEQRIQQLFLPLVSNTD